MLQRALKVKTVLMHFGGTSTSLCAVKVKVGWLDFRMALQLWQIKLFLWKKIQKNDPAVWKMDAVCSRFVSCNSARWVKCTANTDVLADWVKSYTWGYFKNKAFRFAKRKCTDLFISLLFDIPKDAQTNSKRWVKQPKQNEHKQQTFKFKFKFNFSSMQL